MNPADRRANPERTERRWIAGVALSLAVTLLVAGSVVAFVATNGHDGAVDSTVAVQRFFDAIAASDPLGVVASLPPGERAALTETLPDTARQLQRLGLLAGFPLDDLGGEVRVEGLKFEIVDLDRDVRRADITAGTVTATWQPGSDPLGGRARAILEGRFHAELPAPGEPFKADLAGLHLMTVKEQGSWYVSIAYTIGEAIRLDRGLAKPWWGRGPGAIGSNTDEEAVKDLVRAFATPMDPGRAQSIAYPEEARALYEYASLFIPEARRSGKMLEQDDGFSFRVDKLDVRVEGGGHVRKVHVTDFDGTFDDGAEVVHVTYSGGCTTIEYGYADTTLDPRVEKRCDGDLSAPTNATRDDRLRQLTAWTELGRTFPTFVVIERSGRWFVSPVRTLVGTFNEMLSELEPGQVDAFVERLGDVWDRYTDSGRYARPSGRQGTSAGTSAPRSAGSGAVR